jgi:hypothetical protein
MAGSVLRHGAGIKGAYGVAGAIDLRSTLDPDTAPQGIGQCEGTAAVQGPNHGPSRE